MPYRFLTLLSLLLLASLLLTGCAKARERREARQAAAGATATVRVAASDPSARLGATPVPGNAPANASERPPAASCDAAAATGPSIETLESGGTQRSYRLFVPSSYDASTPMPLVLNFHGFGSNALEQERYSDFPALAEREGFIVATPDGTNSPQRWYIYGQLEPGYVDDFGFTGELIDAISARYCIDSSRVYATGISNGGGITSLLGCRLNDRIAAIAPVAGSPYSPPACSGAGPMPVVAFHGTDDALVPFEGGPGGRLGLPINPVRDNMRGWAEHNGCDLTLQTRRIAGDVVLESYGGCNGGANVQLYVIEGGGHTWPGASRDLAALGSTTHSVSATELAWRFFAEQARR
ncbi:MAG TPA: PHB depolymerase family esterase [Dehalococcoidia bacterium]|nr:PHB depolymerase family esterase [Dehalococcoidia bacterium]